MTRRCSPHTGPSLLPAWTAFTTVTSCMADIAAAVASQNGMLCNVLFLSCMAVTCHRAMHSGSVSLLCKQKHYIADKEQKRIVRVASHTVVISPMKPTSWVAYLPREANFLSCIFFPMKPTSWVAHSPHEANFLGFSVGAEGVSVCKGGSGQEGRLRRVR